MTELYEAIDSEHPRILPTRCKVLGNSTIQIWKDKGL